MLKQNDLVSSEETITLEERRAFLKLPLAERQRLLSQQAEEAARYYESEQSTQEREAWQGGDICRVLACKRQIVAKYGW